MEEKKHPVWKTAAVAGTALLLTEGVNRLVFRLAGGKNALLSDDGSFYDWMHGTFFYKKKGEGGGRPLLILHDLSPDCCADDCEALADALAKSRPVYTMDLLGCGRSAKPAMTYTNFLYVLQVTEMIEKQIRGPVHLVAQGRSGAIAIAAAHYRPENVAQITLLDPKKPQKPLPDAVSRLKKTLIELPTVGTMAYNLAFGLDPAAHMGGPSARYLYASEVGRYTDYDVEWMLKTLSAPLHVIETGRGRGEGEKAEEAPQAKGTVQAAKEPQENLEAGKQAEE